MTPLFHRLFYYYLPLSGMLYNLIIGEHEYVKVVQVLHGVFFPFTQLKDFLFQKNALYLKLEIFTQKY